MTYPPEGSRPTGPGSSGYGSYSPTGQSFGGAPTHGQQPPYSQGQPQYGQGQPQYGQGQPPQYGQGQSQYGQVQASPQFGHYNPPLRSDKPSSLSRILSSVVLALGVVLFLVGLAGQYEAFGETSNFFLISSGDPTSVALMLAAGLTAGVGLLPNQPKTIGIAAALAVSGWFVLLFQSFNTGDAGPSGMTVGIGVGAIAVLVLGFVQSAVAVVATLLHSGVLKAPQQKPVSYGQQNSTPGFGQSAGGYGQSSQQPSQSSSGQQSQAQSGQGQSGYSGYGQQPGYSGSGYVPPAYTGPQAQSQSSQGQPSSQNPTGGLGFPVGTAKQESSGGHTGPVGHESSYGQYHYGQAPAGSGSYGVAQHAAGADGSGSVESGADADTDSVPATGSATEAGNAPEGGHESTSNDSAPTRAFGTPPAEQDKK